MGVLIDLFTKRLIEETGQVMDTDAEGFVDEFFDTHLGEFMEAVRGLEEAGNVDDLEHFMQRIQKLVSGWPNAQRT